MRFHFLAPEVLASGIDKGVAREVLVVAGGTTEDVCSEEAVKSSADSEVTAL